MQSQKIFCLMRSQVMSGTKCVGTSRRHYDFCEEGEAEESSLNAFKDGESLLDLDKLLEGSVEHEHAEQHGGIEQDLVQVQVRSFRLHTHGIAGCIRQIFV